MFGVILNSYLAPLGFRVKPGMTATVPGMAALAVALLLAVGCAKVETVGGFSDKPMTFRTYTPRVVKSGAETKAATAGAVVSPGALPADSQFGVFAFYQPGVVGSSTGTWGDGGARSSWTPDFMFNQMVDFDGSDYDYSPLRYWPANEDNTISFWAYYPYELYATDNSGALKFYESNGTTNYSASSTGLPYIKYTVPKNPAQQYDILFDSFVNKNRTYDNGAGSGQVPMTFRHALALVEFRLREGGSESATTDITEMTVGPINWSGTCSNPVDRTWFDQGNPDSIVVEDLQVQGGVIIRLLVMPQTLTNAMKLTINYDLEFESSDPVHSPEPIVYSDNTGTVNLLDAKNAAGNASANITAWEAGHHYIYYIDAGYDRIEFEEVVVLNEDWASAGEMTLN